MVAAIAHFPLLGPVVLSIVLAAGRVQGKHIELRCKLSFSLLKAAAAAASTLRQVAHAATATAVCISLVAAFALRL